MVPLFRKFRKEEYEEDTSGDYLVIEEEVISSSEKKDEVEKVAEVRVFVLDSYDDIRHILDTIRGGRTLCLIDIHLLRNKDPDELRRAIEKLKKTSEAVGGELVGFHESWVLAAPPHIHVHKGNR